MKAQVIRRREVRQAPLGTVRVRREAGKPAFREVKVGLTGPVHRRWMAYARWWWLKNKGPIPEGLRVLHVDGDSMNDDPANLMLGTAADNVFLAHDRDPAMSKDNFRRMREATAEHNRLRSRIRRAVDWLNSRWYPVDLAAKVVHNTPTKKRYQVWAAAGFDAGQPGRNGEGCEAVALGYPGMPVLQAVVLDVLIRVENADGAELRQLAGQRYADFGMTFPASAGPLYTTLCQLRAAGLITTRRQGRHPALYAATTRATSSRGPTSAVVPVMGSTLRADPRFAAFRRLDDQVGTRERVSAYQGLAALARAIAGEGAA